MILKSYIIYLVYCFSNYFSPSSAAACLLDHDYIIQTIESNYVDKEIISEESIEIDNEILDPSYVIIVSSDNHDSEYVDNESMVSKDLYSVMYSTNIHNNAADETVSDVNKRKLCKKDLIEVNSKIELSRIEKAKLKHPFRDITCTVLVECSVIVKNCLLIIDKAFGQISGLNVIPIEDNF